MLTKMWRLHGHEGGEGQNAPLMNLAGFMCYLSMCVSIMELYSYKNQHMEQAGVPMIMDESILL